MRAFNDGDRSAGDHKNPTASTQIVESPQKAHEYAEQLIKTSHAAVVSSTDLVPLERAITKNTHDVGVARQSDLLPLSLDATGDRANKEKISGAHLIREADTKLTRNGLNNAMPAVGASGVQIVEEGLLEDNECKQHQILNLQTEGVQQAVNVNEGVVGVPNASVQVDTRNNASRANEHQGDGKKIITANGFGTHGTAGQKNSGQNRVADVGISAGVPKGSSFEPGYIQQVCDRPSAAFGESADKSTHLKTIVVTDEGQDQVGVMAFECESTTGTKGPNIEANDP